MSDDGPSRGDKLLILTALIFSVRTFRNASRELEQSTIGAAQPSTVALLKAGEADERQLMAERSSLDAHAILKAVEQLK